MIVDWEKIKFQRYDRDNLMVPGLEWYLMTYNRATGKGTYLLRYQPNTKTKPHQHMVLEEFIILSGKLFDSSGDVSYLKVNELNPNKIDNPKLSNWDWEKLWTDFHK